MTLFQHMKPQLKSYYPLQEQTINRFASICAPNQPNHLPQRAQTATLSTTSAQAQRRRSRSPLLPTVTLLRPAQATKPPQVFTAARRTMASDGDYMSFLDKANQDVSGGSASTAQKGGSFQFKATDTEVEVPKEIKEVTQDAFFVSEADEPFVAVALKYDGSSLPDEGEFAKLIKHWDPNSSDIEIMDPVDWDKKGQYKNVLDAVTQATKGNDVRVYRVPKDRSRVEYWLISVYEGRVYGVKALSVES